MPSPSSLARATVKLVPLRAGCRGTLRGIRSWSRILGGSRRSCPQPLRPARSRVDSNHDPTRECKKSPKRPPFGDFSPFRGSRSRDSREGLGRGGFSIAMRMRKVTQRTSLTGLYAFSLEEIEEKGEKGEKGEKREKEEKEEKGEKGTDIDEIKRGRVMANAGTDVIRRRGGRRARARSRAPRSAARRSTRSAVPVRCRGRRRGTPPWARSPRRCRRARRSPPPAR